MRIQKETDYALRCVLCLALKPGEIVTGDELVKLTAAPKASLKKIVTVLSAAGILNTRSGPAGGIWLAKAPREVTVYDVVSCIEGELQLNLCLGANGVCSRNGRPGCGVHRYLSILQDEIRRSMSTMTFEKIVAQNEEVPGQCAAGRTPFLSKKAPAFLAVQKQPAGSDIKVQQPILKPDIDLADKASLV